MEERGKTGSERKKGRQREERWEREGKDRGVKERRDDRWRGETGRRGRGERRERDLLTPPLPTTSSPAPEPSLPPPPAATSAALSTSAPPPAGLFTHPLPALTRPHLVSAFFFIITLVPYLF